MEIEILDAIKNKNLIEIYYKDKLRVVEPHCYGISTCGKEYLIAYEIDINYKKCSYSWKKINLLKAEDVNVLINTFKKTRNGFEKININWTKIHSILK